MCGFASATVDEMTLPEVYRVWRYWRKHPPTHLLLAARYGFKPPLSAEEQIAQGAMSPEDFARWVGATGGKAMGPSAG